MINKSMTGRGIGIGNFLGIVLAAIGPFFGNPAAAVEPLLGLERAIHAGRQLAGRGDVVAAAQAIQIAMIYERTVSRRQYDIAADDSELLLAYLSYVEPGVADRFAAGTAHALSEPRRRLIRTLIQPPKGNHPLDNVPDDAFCRVVRDLSDLRPGELRRSLALVLADSVAPPACLAQSLFFNTEIRAEDTTILRQLGSAGNPTAIAALVRQLVNVGRFAEALALGAHIRDSALRERMETAVISARQLTGLRLARAETSKAIFDAVLRRAGPEREIFGSLLAAQAAPEFWLENAGAVQGFLTSVTDHSNAGVLRDIWSRQMLARGGYALAARVWAAAPALMPGPDFLAAFFFLRDDAPAITGPEDKQLGGIPLPLRRLATVARLTRLPDQQTREATGLFRALLESYAAQGRGRITALDAGFLAAAAARFETSGPR